MNNLQVLGGIAKGFDASASIANDQHTMNTNDVLCIHGTNCSCVSDFMTFAGARVSRVSTSIKSILPIYSCKARVSLANN